MTAAYSRSHNDMEVPCVCGNQRVCLRTLPFFAVHGSIIPQPDQVTTYIEYYGPRRNTFEVEQEMPADPHVK